MACVVSKVRGSAVRRREEEEGERRGGRRQARPLLCKAREDARGAAVRCGARRRGWWKRGAAAGLRVREGAAAPPPCCCCCCCCCCCGRCCRRQRSTAGSTAAAAGAALGRSSSYYLLAKVIFMALSAHTHTFTHTQRGEHWRWETGAVQCSVKRRWVPPPPPTPHPPHPPLTHPTLAGHRRVGGGAGVWRGDARAQRGAGAGRTHSLHRRRARVWGHVVVRRRSCVGVGVAVSAVHPQLSSPSTAPRAHPCVH